MVSNTDDAEMTVSIDQPNPEIALVNTSEPPASTLRARFVGQGYKQVISVRPAMFCSYIHCFISLHILLENNSILVDVCGYL